MLDSKYNHKIVEENKYETWLSKGYFNCLENKELKPYSIVIPPPNVTGILHLGHAWDTTIQDILIRYHRMNGYDVLWLPGMDHAGIATQAKVDAKLKGMGINPRGINREDWLKYAWSWKEEYALNIHNQWSKLGLSLDYRKERFTLDEGLSHAVRKVFVDLYNKGLIYRGYRIINWDPVAMTALSNEEVIYKDIKGAFYHLKYKIENTNEYLEVATTRPETLFGDTAVAVNPNDVRYQKYIGKNVLLPITNKLIPIIADNHADMEFGTGVVKITPAHDPNDYEVGLRHNLSQVIVINPDGTMNENAGIYNGLDRFVCREKLLNDLKETDNLISVEEMVHSVGHSERTDTIVEPYLSRQWFVKMRPLADNVLKNQQDKNNKVNFVPARYEKVMNHWMEITYDWCISRQLWWGHQIPAWYKDNEVYVGINPPKEAGWVQDEDVLDTWFSSALWPFSTMGWPEQTDLLNRYYPNNVLVTGYDIIPFWVNRMTFQALEFTNKAPFKDCLIHGLIRDKDGRKMSKSLGNGVDPMEVIEKYGADSLRYFLTTNTAPGLDLRYDEDKVKATWNFINKIWNATRYVMLNSENTEKSEKLTIYDKWILTKLNHLIEEVKSNMTKYEFNNAGSAIYNFTWNVFCDWYIELSKLSFNKEIINKCLISIVKILHPFMPYVTEEIFKQLLNTDESIMISAYPIVDNNNYIEETKLFDQVINLITEIRNVKQEKSLGKKYFIKFLITDDEIVTIIKKIMKISDEQLIVPNGLEEICFGESNLKVVIYYENIVSEEDTQKKEKEILLLQNNIKRRLALLSNDGYLKKAPTNLVEQEKETLKKEQERLNNLLK